ncbi:MAG: cobalamin B12-binding domain-containing protein [Nitrospirales bacterium]|nr:MAG: cobalamin B12-binding domain-containing protein [Nitrospirales bacterium]
MKDTDEHARHMLADKLKFLESKILKELTTNCCLHPSILQEYGELGKSHCEKDLHYHLSFLRNAIEFGDTTSFQHYVQWTGNVLKSRNIAHETIEVFFNQLATVLATHLSEPEKKMVRPFFRKPDPEFLPSNNHSSSTSTSPLVIHQEVFLQALLVGDRHAAKTVALEVLANGFSLLDLYIEVFQQSLYTIGHLWEVNRISVAQEHVATAITQYIMAQIFQSGKSVAVSLKKGIITGVEGEFHQVGARMVADILEAHGWDIQFLGSNLPQKSILQMVQEYRPALVGISVTMFVNLAPVKDLIGEIRRCASDHGTPRVLVGGSAFRLRPTVYREIGADGFASDLRTLLTSL